MQLSKGEWERGVLWGVEMGSNCIVLGFLLGKIRDCAKKKGWTHGRLRFSVMWSNVSCVNEWDWGFPRLMVTNGLDEVWKIGWESSDGEMFGGKVWLNAIEAQ